MSKELPYFKFFASEWLLGRISAMPDKIQGAFILAIAHYWSKDCDYNPIEFEQKLGKSRYKVLSELNFIEAKNSKVSIPFLDEQFIELSEIHLKRIKGGLARAEQMREQMLQQVDEHSSSYIEKDEEKEKIITEIVVYLNEKSKSDYRPGTKKTRELISARLDTYSADEIKKVIDIKCAEWLGTEQEKYLRPETLFNATKFENYVNQRPREIKEVCPYTPEEINKFRANLQGFGSPGKDFDMKWIKYLA